MSELFGRLRHRSGLLLMLAAALLGFLLLINLLGSLTASGPEDILATAPSEDRQIGLPSGAGLFAFAIGAVGLILGAVAIVGTVSLARRDQSAPLRRYLVGGAVAALALAGVGLFLAFSGILSENVAYDQHQALRPYVEPKGLAVLGAFSLTLVLVAAFRPKLLVVHLAVWLVLSLIFGFFASNSLAGLNLFDEAEESIVEDAYAAEVEKYRRPQLSAGDVDAVHWDSTFPLGTGNSALVRGSSLLMQTGTSAEPASGSSPRPLFTVTGAGNTTRLRTATGDVYENGEWLQLDPVTLDPEAWADLPRGILDMLDEGLVDEALLEQALDALLPIERAISDLLAQPSATPKSFNIDHISVSPAEGFESLEPGTLPIAAYPLGVRDEGSWSPFSQTFRSDQPVFNYEWRSMALEYAREALAQAKAVDDQTYYQLPDGLPQRVRDLASEITRGIDSPYEKASAIAQYLGSEYSYRETQPGQQIQQVPEGRDPVDWFLFDEQSGGATSFSSAFSVLARASGVPARVVSGWAISPTAETQTVHSDQGHQWAEIALEQFGWIPFDPTPGGVPDKVAARTPQQMPDGSGHPGQSAGDGTGTEGESQGEGMGEGSGAPSDAGQELNDIREEIALRNLANALNPEVREQAAEVLGGIGSDGAIEALAHSLFNDLEESVRAVSTRSMASLNLELLVEILQEHPEPIMREAAAISLGRKGDPKALSPLGNTLVNRPDSNEGVREAAASALGDLLMPEAVEPLSQALDTDESPEVRKASAAALGALGEGSSASLLEQALASDSEVDVREASAEALGDLLESSSLPALLGSRADDPSPRVRGASSRAISRFTQRGIVQALEDSDDPAVRTAAAQILGERGDPTAADNLINALQDPNQEVKEVAQDALNSLGSITPLENGGGLVSHSAGTSFIPGTTSAQAAEIPHVPVFEVEDAIGVDFLRTAVGDTYVNGQWIPDQQAQQEYWAGYQVPVLGPAARVTVQPSRTQNGQIWVSPAAGELWILEGYVPISSQPGTLSIDGTLFLDSETFSSSRRVDSYNWTSTIPVYSVDQLVQGNVSPHYRHTVLPDGIPGRVRILAERITAGESTPYRKARAIEQYLQANYTYRLADPSQGGVPEGHDPVDWFLFESREGTCGNFSSAFVILARSVGLPARVVAGWSITPTGNAQTVYADQAHQRAEIAFDGMGWVPFEPTAGGATERAQSGEQGGSGFQQQRRQIENLVQQLSSDQPGVQEQARQALEGAGAQIVQTENGGTVVTGDGRGFGIGVGTTTRQVVKPETGRDGKAMSVFFVTGAAHTTYLRSTSGDIYRNGNWQKLEPASLDYDANQSILHLVRNEIARTGTGLDLLANGRTVPGLLTGFQVNPPITYTDTIVLEATPELGNFPAGVVPTSQFLDEVDGDGRYHPISGTFSLDTPAESYGWVSRVPQFSSDQLQSADVVSGSIYTQLPEGLPDRIRQLALEITGGHDSPYAKARALESYLSSQYTYRFADGTGSEAPPPGRDPVDWFLFDQREGTCGVFSTAFVVMARSIGIPARVATGWAISSTIDRQEVRIDQAHQWAEVAFEGLGWVQFEPTASSGAPSRTEQAREQAAESLLQGGDDKEISVVVEVPPQPIVEERTQLQPALPLDTVTAITSWPEQIRRRTAFTIGGTVRTTSGSPVSGLQVEIFINETKEHGGTRIGEATALNGRFQVEVSVPSSTERGGYQLLAHAISNEQYEESWSDPDITVYSEGGLQLTGPGEVPVDTQALFRGKVLDDSGSGVADMDVQVIVDGRDLPPQSTSKAGEFAFSLTFAEVGDHVVEVGFEGRDFLLGNTARLEVAAVMPTELIVSIPGEASIGEEFLIKGLLRNVRGQPLPQAEVTLTVGDGPPWTAFTGDDGRFSTPGVIGSVGLAPVRTEFAGDYPVLSTVHTGTVTARHLTEISIVGPSSVLQGEEAFFTGRISSKTLPETGSLQVIIEDGEGDQIGTATTRIDGSFEYRSPGFDDAGPRTLTARFREQEELTSSSAGFSFSVVVPTVLTVEGPSLVAAQDRVELIVTLGTLDGEPVPGVPVWVGDPDSLPLITGPDGTLSREFPLFADLGENQTEAIRNIAFGFDGTDRLAPAIRSHALTVGLPWLSVEPTEPVARGETATLRGTVLLGSRPIPDTIVTTPSGAEALTNAAGSFVLRYPVPSDAPLGREEVPVSVAGLDLNAAVPLDVKSAVSLLVVPLEDVRPGRPVLVQASLLDDEGRGIAGATVSSSQGEQAETDNSGVAQLTVEAPDDADTLAVPVTFTYEGDGIHLPLEYLAALPVTQTGFNWLLWAGLPAMVVVVLLSGFAARRWSSLALPGGIRQRVRNGRDAETMAAGVLLPGDAESDEPEPETPPDPETTRLELALERPAPDLPTAWGPGEQVTVLVTLSVEDGPVLPQLWVELQIPGGERVPLQTDQQGRCVYTWQADTLGEFAFTVEFGESGLYLASTASAEFRVVNFREEIVRLYNKFAAWTGGLIARTSDRTPRELESILVASGESMDFRAVNEIISRFEEADYSEHEIGRRQYESMYRAWILVVEDQYLE